MPFYWTPLLIFDALYLLTYFLPSPNLLTPLLLPPFLNVCRDSTINKPAHCLHWDWRAHAYFFSPGIALWRHTHALAAHKEDITSRLAHLRYRWHTRLYMPRRHLVISLNNNL